MWCVWTSGATLAVLCQQAPTWCPRRQRRRPSYGRAFACRPRATRAPTPPTTVRSSLAMADRMPAGAMKLVMAMPLRRAASPIATTRQAVVRMGGARRGGTSITATPHWSAATTWMRAKPRRLRLQDCHHRHQDRRKAGASNCRRPPRGRPRSNISQQTHSRRSSGRRSARTSLRAHRPHASTSACALPGS